MLVRRGAILLFDLLSTVTVNTTAGDSRLCLSRRVGVMKIFLQCYQSNLFSAQCGALMQEVFLKLGKACVHDHHCIQWTSHACKLSTFVTCLTELQNQGTRFKKGMRDDHWGHVTSHTTAKFSSASAIRTSHRIHSAIFRFRWCGIEEKETFQKNKFFHWLLHFFWLF